MLVDSCCICSKILTQNNAFCFECQNFLRSKDLLLRLQNELPIFSLMTLNHESRALVMRCKRAQDLKLIKELAKILSQKIQDTVVAEIAGVIPVPAKKDLNQDHAFMLGYYIAQYLNKSFWPQCLEFLGVDSQKTGAVKERSLVRIGCVERLPKVSPAVWILIDDVITTGHTLLEAHKALGFPKAVSLTLASRPFRI